jgi:hypothetical protein
MNKWDRLKTAAQEASKFKGSTPNYYVPIQAPLILELIADAKREGANKSGAIFTERTPDGWIEFRRISDRSLIMKFPMSRLQEYVLQAAKPKTIVEEIREEIGKREEGLREGWGEVAEALLEAVESIKDHMDACEEAGNDDQDCQKNLKSILAILKGEKTREIPK